MSHPVVRKLRRGALLTAADEARVREALLPTRLSGRSKIFLEGDAPDGLLFLMEGLACRYKDLHSGARQIIALLLPGDACDVYAPLLNSMDHGLSTLASCTIAHVPRSVVSDWMHTSSTLRQAMNWSVLTDEAILREWLVSLGARSASERMAHLFCELHMRLLAVGEADEDRFDLPMTQEELGQTLGLSNVHVNRTIARLRDGGLAAFARGKVRILNAEALQRFSSFRSNYLHLEPLIMKADAGQDIGF